MTTGESAQTSLQKSRVRDKNSKDRPERSLVSCSNSSHGQTDNNTITISTEDNDHDEPPFEGTNRLDDQLVYKISTLVGSHVHVTIKNGTQFEGYLLMTSTNNDDLDIVLKQARIINSINTSNNNNSALTDTLTIQGCDLVKINASDVCFYGGSDSSGLDRDFVNMSMMNPSTEKHASRSLNCPICSEVSDALPADQSWNGYYSHSGGSQPYYSSNDTYRLGSADPTNSMNRHYNSSGHLYDNVQWAHYSDKSKGKSHWKTKTRQHQYIQRSYHQWTRNDEKCTKWVGNQDAGLSEYDNTSLNYSPRQHQGHYSSTSKHDVLYSSKSKYGKKKGDESHKQHNQSATHKAISLFKFNIMAKEFVPHKMEPYHSIFSADDDFSPTQASIQQWLSPPFDHPNHLTPKATEPLWPCGTIPYRHHFNIFAGYDWPFGRYPYQAYPAYQYPPYPPYHELGRSSSFSMTTRAGQMMMYGPPVNHNNQNIPLQHLRVYP